MSMQTPTIREVSGVFLEKEHFGERKGGGAELKRYHSGGSVCGKEKATRHKVFTLWSAIKIAPNQGVSGGLASIKRYGTSTLPWMGVL
jgi:hypothetical protein